MMDKKYYLVASLLTAAALLSGCSTANENPATSTSASPSPTTKEGGTPDADSPTDGSTLPSDGSTQSSNASSIPPAPEGMMPAAPNQEPNGQGANRDGIVRGSQTNSQTPATTFEEGVMEVVTLPASVTESEAYVPVPFEDVSGSVVETDTETAAVFNAYKGEETRNWVAELVAAGWMESEIDTLDNQTTYNALLTHKDGRSISLYSNNTSETQNTLIVFSK